MTAVKLQTTTFALLALLIPLSFFGERWLWRSEIVGIGFLGSAYIAAAGALGSTALRYHREPPNSLSGWRRILYAIGLACLIVLGLLPLAAWPITLSGITVPGSSVLIRGLFAMHIAAALMILAGRGWARAGLIITSYWILFLWVFPLSLRE